MAFNELVKDFSRIRDYMRQFYVFGFKTRDEYHEKSARSYDNERRRIESWLKEYMFFGRDSAGKNVFIAVDSSEIQHNPLYLAFRAKSFTNNDITLHFYILDILHGKSLSIREIQNHCEKYLALFDDAPVLEESTLRKKLKEYETLGVLTCRKQGRELIYSLSEDYVDLAGWNEAIAFFSETAPLGIIGSYLLDKFENPPKCFGFKHHYILHALESEILYGLLLAIGQRREATVRTHSSRRQSSRDQTVVPMQIMVSTQGGRRYLLCRHQRYMKMMLYRLDSIKSVKVGEVCPSYDIFKNQAQKYKEHLWGASPGVDFSLDHLEMTVFIGEQEGYILKRLQREKRGGRVHQLDKSHYRFSIDVYDACEMLPWIRTFIGRISEITCSNPYVSKLFHDDLKALSEMYEETSHAVQ